MKRLYLVLGMSLASSVVAYTPLEEQRTTVVKLAQIAEEQVRALDHALAHPQTLRKLSLDEAKELLSSVDTVLNDLNSCPKGHPDHTRTTRIDYVRLMQESARRINVRLEMIKDTLRGNTRSIRVIVPLGAGCAVVGGLLLLSVLTDFNISTKAALTCGVVTTIGVGIAMNAHVLKGFLSRVGELVGNGAALLVSSDSMSTVLGAGAAVAGMAVAGGLAYSQRDRLAHLLGIPSGKTHISQLRTS